MPWLAALDYLDLNSLRRYPIREGTNVTSDDLAFVLPDTFIVDFSLSATNDVTARYYISAIFNYVFSATIQISDFSTSEVVGAVSIDFNTHTTNNTYYFTGIGDYANANGKITIGTLDDFKRQPAGNFTFSNTATELEPRTIIPGLAGVQSITYVDSIGSTRTLSGDVTVQARSNMIFTWDSVNNAVIMDVGDGLGLNKDCGLGNCVKRINGISPDPDTGNITLLGIGCLQISSTGAYTLDFADSCCTPCSGCTDLTTLTARLTSLENNFINLKNYYNTLDNQLTNYLTTVNSNCSC